MTSADRPRPGPRQHRPQVPFAHPAGGTGSILDPLDPTKTGPRVPGTPAPGPDAHGPGPDRDDPRFGAEAFSVLAFLAGVWLVIAPFALDHDGSAAAWNDTVVGIAVAAVALVRMLAPARTAALGIVNVGLGAWLVVAPLVLDLPTAAARNDVVVGILLVLVAAASAALGYRARRRRDR